MDSNKSVVSQIRQPRIGQNMRSNRKKLVQREQFRQVAVLIFRCVSSGGVGSHGGVIGGSPDRSDAIGEEVVGHHSERDTVGGSRREEVDDGKHGETTRTKDHGMLTVFFVDNHGFVEDSFLGDTKEDGREGKTNVNSHGSPIEPRIGAIIAVEPQRPSGGIHVKVTIQEGTERQNPKGFVDVVAIFFGDELGKLSISVQKDPWLAGHIIFGAVVGGGGQGWLVFDLGFSSPRGHLVCLASDRGGEKGWTEWKEKKEPEKRTRKRKTPGKTAKKKIDHVTHKVRENSLENSRKKINFCVANTFKVWFLFFFSFCSRGETSKEPKKHANA